MAIGLVGWRSQCQAIITRVAGSLRKAMWQLYSRGTLEVFALAFSLVPSMVPFWSRSGSILVSSLHLTSTRASRVGWPSTNDWIDGHWGASPQLLIIDCMCSFACCELHVACCFYLLHERPTGVGAPTWPLLTQLGPC
jgi:hypothetical protein